MIQRLPAIGLSVFSALVVATPIAMLLSTFVSPPSDTVELEPPLRAERPAAATPPAITAPSPVVFDDSGEPVVVEPVEKTE